MKKIERKKDCCGCSACASACPKGAIRMEADGIGFLYPKIDENKCIDCGLCDKVCPFKDDYDKSLNLTNPDCFMGRHKDLDQLKMSRSGAVFVAVSDYILDNNGVVYGAGFSSHFKVVHKRATSKKERDEFRGSKYVQSDVADIFPQVKNDLKQGRLVLFSGTPCQCAGLNAFVGKTLRKQLYLMDVVCHGTPAPKIWDDYLSFLEKKRKSPIISISFRDKDYGWDSHQETYVFGDVKEKETFDFFFYQPIFFRESCGNCHFSNLCRPSDITIGDFWGWEKIDSEMNSDNLGVNLILCNTEKGRSLFDQIKLTMIFKSVQIKDCDQPQLNMPCALPSWKKNFEEDYVRLGFEKAMKKYAYMGYRCKLKKMIKRLVGRIKGMGK